jgi:hypothetical protein
MSLFSRKERHGAAEAEMDRLRALSPEGLAAEVLRALGPDGLETRSGHRQGPIEIVGFLMPSAPVRYRQPLLAPVIEALQDLENAGLVSRRSFGSNGNASTYHLTRRGTEAAAA